MGLVVSGWVIYGPGERVKCPGTYRARRETHRSDRRVAARIGPCQHKWGRPGPRTETWTRHKQLGQVPSAGLTLVFECSDCHCPIEFQTHAASNEAA